MGHSEYDPSGNDWRPWNVGRMLGAERALKPQHVWAIRFWLDNELRSRSCAGPVIRGQGVRGSASLA
jgi:hypothetical protein